VAEKRRKKRRKEKERKREILGYRECCFSFLLKPWRNKTRPLPRLRMVTYKAS
jgi:hypothetical protein